MRERKIKKNWFKIQFQNLKDVYNCYFMGKFPLPNSLCILYVHMFAHLNSLHFTLILIEFKQNKTKQTISHGFFYAYGDIETDRKMIRKRKIETGIGII